MIIPHVGPYPRISDRWHHMIEQDPAKWVADKEAADEIRTLLPEWLRDSCTIDDSEERDAIVDAFLLPKFSP